MTYSNRKELAEEMDNVIARFMAFTVDINDTKKEHSSAFFHLVREGYKLCAKSPTRLIKSVSVPIDDVFSTDEHLQELHELAINSINNSTRYKTF